MKNLRDYVNHQYVSLYGLDENIIERLSNIDGIMINECDCGCLDYGDCACNEPCSCEPCTSNVPVSTSIDPITDIKGKFYGQPKVYDLLNAHTTLDYKCRFLDVIQGSLLEPLFFTDYNNTLAGYDRSKKLRDDILTICKDFDFLWPVIMIKNNGDIQLFAAKKFGTNGKECSIKNSLIEAADILDKLEKRKEIEWAQVLDVSIDNYDDLYDFLFTVTFNKEKYDKELEELRNKDLKSASKIPATF